VKERRLQGNYGKKQKEREREREIAEEKGV
jgi:hypothetical protein